MSMLVVVLLLCGVLGIHGQGLPPSISRQNEELEVFLAVDSKFMLICDAEGPPDPDYEWYLDDRIWNFMAGDVTLTQGSGNITINSFSYNSAGKFQCIASNKYGKTMTRKIKVEMALIAKFPQEDTKELVKDENQALKIECNVPKSSPYPTISWRPVESLDLNPQSVNQVLSRRVQIDDDGNLVFAYVMKDDELNGWFYRCFAENTIAGLSAFGSYAQLTVNPSGNPGETIKPIIQSYTGQNTQGGIVTALKRKSVSLRCLFSGKPEPRVKWSRLDKKPLPQDRIDYEHFDTVLIIDDVEDYDEAIYVCTGSNSAGNAEHQLTVNVEAIPEFVDELSKPKNMNVTDGENAVFMCDTEAEPEGDVIWYVNSKKLEVNIPDRVTIDPDRKKSLRISKVCKDCKNGGTDLKVYACEVENEHGSTFSSGYLNVLLPTVIVTLPQDYDLTLREDEVVFTCEGTTDETTPLSVQWLWDGKRIQYIQDEIYPVPTGTGSELHIATRDLEHSGKEYLGNYTCILSNGYSSVNATASLNEIPGVLPIKKSGVADLWWVFLIVGILLLLLLLLLCCCICIQRNKGDSYPVDEKERANGNDPEKELADSGYQDYQRPEEEPVKGSRASLNSVMKLDDSDDDGSLAEYGDIDTGKFNEDGSFIGQYDTADRRRGDTNV